MNKEHISGEVLLEAGMMEEQLMQKERNHLLKWLVVLLVLAILMVPILYKVCDSLPVFVIVMLAVLGATVIISYIVGLVIRIRRGE